MGISNNTLEVAHLAKRNYANNLKQKWVEINKLYMEMYAMPTPELSGVFHMVSSAFYECWQARGSDFSQMLLVENDSLPANVWRVGGRLHRGNARFSGKQILEAKVLSMLSYIRLTEVKYLPGYYLTFK